MNLPPAAAAAITLTGCFVLSLGMTLQKRHIGWTDRSKGRSEGTGTGRQGAVRDFAPWLLGFMLVNVVPAFQYFGLLGLSTNVVAAIAGSSVAFTAVLARLMLGERLGRRALAWTAALFASIAAAGLLGEGGSSAAAGLSPAALYAALCIPLAAGAALFAARFRVKGERRAALAVAVAACSGCLGGFMVFPLRALQVAASPGILGWLASPYLYAFLAAGSSSLVLIQAAYRDGKMVSVAPAYYGMQVLWPALGSLFVFGASFIPAQAGAFVLVALCVAAVSR